MFKYWIYIYIDIYWHFLLKNVGPVLRCFDLKWEKKELAIHGLPKDHTPNDQRPLSIFCTKKIGVMAAVCLKATASPHSWDFQFEDLDGFGMSFCAKLEGWFLRCVKSYRPSTETLHIRTLWDLAQGFCMRSFFYKDRGQRSCVEIDHAESLHGLFFIVDLVWVQIEIFGTMTMVFLMDQGSCAKALRIFFRELAKRFERRFWTRDTSCQNHCLFWSLGWILVEHPISQWTPCPWPESAPFPTDLICVYQVASDGAPQITLKVPFFVAKSQSDVSCGHFGHRVTRFLYCWSDQVWPNSLGSETKSWPTLAGEQHQYASRVLQAGSCFPFNFFGCATNIFWTLSGNCPHMGKKYMTCLQPSSSDDG